jgi:hypothetical protein
MPVKKLLHLLTALTMLGATAYSDDTEQPQTSRQKNLQAVERAYAHASTGETVRTWRAVLADRDAGTVEILAESTGMPAGEPVEFFLITPASGHDYEAFAVCFARAADIRSALEFIGIPPGQPADYSKLRMWPQGERVIIEAAVTDTPPTEPAPPETQWTRAEDLLIGPEGRSLPREGFVFTGSYFLPDGQLAPDADTPHSVASFYNEPQSLFDVPRIAPQGAVYGRTEINPANQPEEGQLLRIRFRHDGAPLPRAVRLEVDIAATDSQSGDLTDYAFTCRFGGSNLLDQASLNQLLALFGAYQQEQRDIYVSITPNPAMTIGQHKQIYAFFESINQPNGIRLVAPEDQVLYYKAFLPDPRYLPRADRPGQPWELHLQADDQGRLHGQAIHLDEQWEPGGEPSLHETAYPVESPAQLPAILAKHPDTFKVVFFFCSDDLPLRILQPWYQALYPDYKTVYFYRATEPNTPAPNPKETE